MQILKEKKVFWRLLHSLRLQSKVVAQIVEETKTQTTFVEDQIKHYLRNAGIPDPGWEAKLLFATIDGMANHYLLLEVYPIDDIADLLIQKYRLPKT